MVSDDTQDDDSHGSAPLQIIPVMVRYETPLVPLPMDTGVGSDLHDVTVSTSTFRKRAISTWKRLARGSGEQGSKQKEKGNKRKKESLKDPPEVHEKRA